MTTRPATDVLARCVDLVRAAEPRCGGTVVVAVDGPSGAGKTTLTRELRRRLDGPPVIHLDAVYPGWDGLAQTPAILHDRRPGPAGSWRAGGVPAVRLGGRRFAEEYVVPPAPLLVVEGCGAGAWPGFGYVSVLIWVEASRDDRYARAMARDGATYRPNWERWAASERALFARDRTRERADLVIDTSAPVMDPSG